MLTVPAGHFQVFHRHLPTMEILVAGKTGDTSKMLVYVTSMGTDLHFDYKFAPGEIIDTTFRNILFKAHKELFEVTKTERLRMQEMGGHVH